MMCVCVVRVWSDMCVVKVMRTAAQETIYCIYLRLSSRIMSR